MTSAAHQARREARQGQTRWRSRRMSCKRCMIDVRSKMCSEPGCPVSASYNLPGHPTLRCTTHKTPGMVDVHSKICSEPGCPVRASCNLHGQPALKCNTHKTPGMVNVVSKLYNDPVCHTLPSYNLPGTLPVKCAAHRLAGMVNVRNTWCCVSAEASTGRSSTRNTCARLATMAARLYSSPSILGWANWPNRFLLKPE